MYKCICLRVCGKCFVRAYVRDRKEKVKAQEFAEREREKESRAVQERICLRERQRDALCEMKDCERDCVREMQCMASCVCVNLGQCVSVFEEK